MCHQSKPLPLPKETWNGKLATIPSTELPNKTQLKTKEKEWMHKWHNTLINNSTTWTRHPKLWNPIDAKYNKQKPLSRIPHQEKCLEKKLAWRYKWQGKAMIILKNNR